MPRGPLRPRDVRGVARSTSGVGGSFLGGGFLDELVSADRRLLASFRASRDAGVRNRRDVQLHRADGIVIAGNDVVDTIGITVGIDDADDRNPELVGLRDGNSGT